MKTKGVVFTGPKQAELADLDVGKLKPDEILIETAVTLISPGTERHFYNGAPFYPFTPGYSVVGTVTAVGDAVKTRKVGQRVTASCQHAREVIAQEGFTNLIPDGVSFEEAAFFQMGLMALYSCRQARVGLGSSVAVLGQGMIGLVTTQVARLCGGLPVIGIDIDDSRLERSKAAGADVALNARDVAKIKETTAMLPGGGVDAILEFTAAKQPVELAMEIVAEGGRIYLGSVSHEEFKVNIHGDLWWKGASIVTGYINSRPHLIGTTRVSMASWPVMLVEGAAYSGEGVTSNARDIDLFLQMIARKRVDVASLITHRFQPQEATRAFASLGQADPGMIGLLFSWR